MITNNPAESNNQDKEDLLPEYSFNYQQARPNRFATEMSQPITSITLDPDVAQVFPTTEAVNEALRFLMRIVKENQPIIQSYDQSH